MFLNLYRTYLKPIPVLHKIACSTHHKIFAAYTKWLAPLFWPQYFKTWRSLVPLSAMMASKESESWLIAKSIEVKTAVDRIFPYSASQQILVTSNDYLFPEIKVCKINNAMVYGGTNMIFTEKQIICHDLYHFDSDYTSEELHSRVVIKPYSKKIRWFLLDNQPQKIPIAASFVDACASNYAHWLTEVLPRVNLFCSDARFAGIPIIVNEGLHDNIMASLLLVVNNRREVLSLKIGHACHVEQLYVISPTGYIPFDWRFKRQSNVSPGIFSPYALQQLASQIKQHLLLPNSMSLARKIYLKRTSGGRKLLNQSIIEEILISHGFVVICPEELTFIEQVALFDQADVIVGATGSACANIIFSRPATKLLVLMAVHKKMPYRYWLNMAAAAGVTSVSYLLATVKTKSQVDIHDDFTINPEDLRSWLKTLDS